MSKVRDSGRECQAAKAQEWQRGATQVGGQGWRPGGPTPCLRPEVASWRTNPTSKEPWLHRHRRA